LAAIKTAIDAKDGSNNGTAIDTVQELQAIVSLYRINDYADNDSTNPAPSIQDYKSVVLLTTGGKLSDAFDSDNNYLLSYNDAVKTKSNGSNHDTFADYSAIKSVVLSYNTILKYADGDRFVAADIAPDKALKLQDLFNVGLGNGWSSEQKTKVLGDGDVSTSAKVQGKTFEVDNNFDLFADVIGGKTKDQVNSIKELNDLANIVSRVIELESKDTTGTTTYDSLVAGRLTIAEFQSLGLDVSLLNSVSGQVQTNRLYSVYDSIINTDTDAIKNLLTLQAYINKTSGINA